jgi:DNA-directed RNA polymerase specialized sigma24 family protein
VPTTIEDRLVVGDATVVAALYRQHGAFIHTISQQLVGAAADRLTQQVFVDAWRNRLEFNPSLGTVRNWLIRQTRDRVSTPSPEADAAVDRLVVADSWARMDDTRRRVLKVGVGATNIEDLASELDLPVATVNGHLRRGLDHLQADLADSRADGDDVGLADIVADGIPELELIEPPLVVWNAVVAELRLSGDAADIDRETPQPIAASHADPELQPDDRSDDDTPDGETPDGGDTAGGDTAGEGVNDGDEIVTTDGDDTSDGDGSDTPDGASAGDDRHPDDAMDSLRAEAVSTKLGRPIWQNPVAVVVALILLAILIAIIF